MLMHGSNNIFHNIDALFNFGRCLGKEGKKKDTPEYDNTYCGVTKVFFVIFALNVLSLTIVFLCGILDVTCIFIDPIQVILSGIKVASELHQVLIRSVCGPVSFFPSSHPLKCVVPCLSDCQLYNIYMVP
jgi:hypothetical protein